jgi:hypothetical protein
MAAASFELPNGFVNYGAHGLRGAGHARLRWRHRHLQALGDYQRLPEWIGYFTRAIDAADTPPRRGELARALGYWAARYRDGQPASPLPPPATCGWRWCGQGPDSRPDLGTCDAGPRCPGPAFLQAHAGCVSTSADWRGDRRPFQVCHFLAQDACRLIGDPVAQVQQVPQGSDDFSSE